MTIQNYYLYDILRYPVSTEKAVRMSGEARQGQGQNLDIVRKYTFFVDPRATKKHVKDAVEQIYQVKVTKVNTANILGKAKPFKGKIGYRKDRKKAIVTLENNQSINFKQLNS